MVYLVYYIELYLFNVAYSSVDAPSLGQYRRSACAFQLLQGYNILRRERWGNTSTAGHVGHYRLSFQQQHGKTSWGRHLC